jgi:hypothetical protein
VRDDDFFDDLISQLERAYDELDGVLGEMYDMGMRQEVNEMYVPLGRVHARALSLLEEQIGEA